GLALAPWEWVSSCVISMFPPRSSGGGSSSAIASGPLAACRLRTSSSRAIASCFRRQVALSWTYSTIPLSLHLAPSQRPSGAGVAAHQASTTSCGAVASLCLVLLGALILQSHLCDKLRGEWCDAVR